MEKELLPVLERIAIALEKIAGITPQDSPVEQSEYPFYGCVVTLLRPVQFNKEITLPKGSTWAMPSIDKSWKVDNKTDFTLTVTFENESERTTKTFNGTIETEQVLKAFKVHEPDTPCSVIQDIRSNGRQKSDGKWIYDHVYKLVNPE